MFGCPPLLLFEIRPPSVICKFDEGVGALVRGAVVSVQGLEDKALGYTIIKDDGGGGVVAQLDMLRLVCGEVLDPKMDGRS